MASLMCIRIVMIMLMCRCVGGRIGTVERFIRILGGSFNAARRHAVLLDDLLSLFLIHLFIVFSIIFMWMYVYVCQFDKLINCLNRISNILNHILGSNSGFVVFLFYSRPFSAIFLNYRLSIIEIEKTGWVNIK